MFEPKPNGNFYAYVAAFLGNILTISYGMLFGSTSYSLLTYKSENSYLDGESLTLEELTWVTTYLCIGALAGTFVFKSASHICGRRTCLLICGLVQINGWFFLVFGYNVTHIYFSRALIGLAAGGSFFILPLYLSEVTKNRITYPIAVVLLSRDFGIFLGCIQQLFITNDTFALVGLVLSVIFSLSFPFVEESPYYYLRENNNDRTEKCLRWFRGIRTLEQRDSEEFLAETKKFKEMYSWVIEENKNYHILNGKAIRALIGSIILTFTTQLCGSFVIVNYFLIIFEEFKADISNEISITLLSGTLLLGSILGTIFIRLSIRKYIIITSSLATGICFGVLGYYMYVKAELGYNLPHMNLVPLLCLLLALCISSAGFYPLSFVITKEFFPQEVATMLFLSIYWTLGLLLIKFYFYYTAVIGLYGYFWVFSGSCILQFLAITIILPKTKAERDLLINI